MSPVEGQILLCYSEKVGEFNGKALPILRNPIYIWQFLIPI